MTDDERAAELEHEADILERDAPNRYRQSIADRRSRAAQIRRLEAECREKGWLR